MIEDEEVTADDIKVNTKTVDITEDSAWMAAARWETAAGYSKLANPKHKLRMRDIYTALCEDGYERDGRSRTLATLTTNPKTGAVEISALVRIVFGRTAGEVAAMPPIDSMNFMHPSGDWPHRKQGSDDNKIAEIGRFTIIDKYHTPRLKESQIDIYLGSCVFGEAMRIARARGLTTIYTIMPKHASELTHRAGYELVEVPSSLKTDEEATKIYERFSVYWRRMTPRLYEVRDGQGHILNAFQAAIGSERILADRNQIDRTYAPNVTAASRRVPLVLRPENDEEVTSIITVANEHRIPLYPFSTGKNWGLGSKLPVTDDCVVVDLSRMNRIVEVNEEFGYAILEPGVTQLDLATYLRQYHPSLTMNFTGSFAYTGVVGNVLDRGDGGHARVDDLLGVRGIFGNGKPFAVGGLWERVGSPSPSHVLRYAAGPDLCGMFCQSNFGIVTQLAFKLIRKPEARYLLWGAAGDGALEHVVDTIDRFAANGVINPGSSNIGYANRFVQAQQTMVGGAEPPVEWNFYVLLGGTRGVARLIADEMLTAISPVCSSSGAFRIGRETGDHDDTATLPPFLHPLVSPLLGLPDASTIKMIYQLTGTPLPADDRDIDADQTPFGMKTCIAIVPPRSRFARAAANLVNEIRRKHGMNVKASFFGDGRCLITIHFRTDHADQVDRATQCEAELWQRLLDAGFPPYRVSIDQMQRLVASRPAFFESVSDLKAALDPNGIISPGRYCPVA